MFARYSPTLGAVHETLGASVAIEGGVGLTSSATVNAKGAWVAVGTTTIEYQSIIIHAGGTSNAGEYVVDLGADDGAGNVTIISPDQHLSAYGTIERLVTRMPLYVPRGTRLTARLACTAASQPIRCHTTGSSAGWYGAPGFGRCVGLTTYTNLRGPAIDAGATANAKGAWTVVTTGVPYRLGAVTLTLGSNAVSTGTANPWFLIDIGLGATGAVFVWVPDQVTRANALHVPIPRNLGPYFGDIPPNTQIQVRCSCSSTTAAERALDVAMHGYVV